MVLISIMLIRLALHDALKLPKPVSLSLTFTEKLSGIIMFVRLSKFIYSYCVYIYVYIHLC